MAIVKKFSAIKKIQKHLLGIQNLSIQEANLILDEAKNFIKLNRSASKKLDLLRGKTQINLFFEPSTRTQSSFELAGKRLGADVMTMNVGNSSLKKGETIDIPLGAKHSLGNDTKENLIVIEVQLGTYFGEDDIIRISDPYNR